MHTLLGGSLFIPSQFEGSKTDSKYILWIYFPLSFMIEKQFENYRRVELLLSKMSLSTLSFYSVTGGVYRCQSWQHSFHS